MQRRVTLLLYLDEPGLRLASLLSRHGVRVVFFTDEDGFKRLGALGGRVADELLVWRSLDTLLSREVVYMAEHRGWLLVPSEALAERIGVERLLEEYTSPIACREYLPRLGSRGAGGGLAFTWLRSAGGPILLGAAVRLPGGVWAECRAEPPGGAPEPPLSVMYVGEETRVAPCIAEGLSLNYIDVFFYEPGEAARMIYEALVSSSG